MPPKKRPSFPPLPPKKAGLADPERVELRLSIGRDGLGLELGAPVVVGPLRVTELVLSMPGVRFPLDVSGGVSRFRHRRGDLQRLTVELTAHELVRWATPRLHGVIGAEACEVWIGISRSVATLALSTRGSVPAFLAFEVSATIEGEDVRLFLTAARGTGLPAPPVVLAMAAMAALLGKSATRAGASFTVQQAAAKLSKGLLPDAGARVPSTESVRWTALATAVDGWILHASRHGTPTETSAHAALAREANLLTREADDARYERAYDRARALDVAVLERAPRHPEVCGRIAEIDRHAGGRAEAALGTLKDSERERGFHHGMLRAELLAEVGDTAAAVAAFAHVGETEVVPVLAARAYERAAELVADAAEGLVWLDFAVVRAPAEARLRWARVARRLALGRIEDAMADAEHLEAQARGPTARHEVWWRAGAEWQKAGLHGEAAPLFERALRFVPDDAEALAGLGRALLAQGRAARGVALLTRSIELAEKASTTPIDRTVLDLARALAEQLSDRPAAIARVRAVRSESPESIEARGLEGRWRAAMGDFAGASLAFARLREIVSTRVEEASSPDKKASLAFLIEAAIFERDVRHDLLASQRLLGAALRLAPHDAVASAAYRDVGARIVGVPAAPPVVEHEPSPPPAVEESYDAGNDDSRVEDLTRKLHADASDDSVVDELAFRLMRLGRAHELLALLSARIEDATPERRAKLIPKQEAVLQHLEDDARARGSEPEVRLFREARLVLRP